VEKRDFDGALNQWQGVKGQVDGFTYWYNLGTLQTLRENYPEARFALEKARFLTLYSDATEHQLRIVNDTLAVDTPTSAMSLGPHITNTLVYGADEVVVLGDSHFSWFPSLNKKNSF
jgi:hypothetical protein